MLKNTTLIFFIILVAQLPVFSKEKSREFKSEFIEQTLNPLGGIVLKPNSWFYSETHESTKSFYWVISKENPKKQHDYHTGMAIQLLLGRGREYNTLVSDIVKFNIMKIHEKYDVIEECDTDIVGEFHRKCIKILKSEKYIGESPQKYIVEYSYLWNNEKDTLVMLIQRSPVAEYEKYIEVFNVMDEVILFNTRNMKTR